MLDQLKEYIKATPIETIQAEWKEIEEEFSTGVNAMEYIDFSKAVYKTRYSPPKEITNEKINFSNNVTSNFSGSFFFRNIAE